MYKLLTTKGQLFALLLGIAVIAIYLFSVMGGLSSAGYGMGDDLNQIMKSNPDADFSFFELPLKIVFTLVVIALAIAVIFGLLQLFSSPKNSLKGIIGAAIIIGLFFLFYTMATAETTGKIGELVQRFNVSPNQSKFISAGINTVGVLSIGALAIMVLSEIRNLFK